jgi:hypothetical protein
LLLGNIQHGTEGPDYNPYVVYLLGYFDEDLYEISLRGIVLTSILSTISVVGA